MKPPVHWAIPDKIQTIGMVDILFWKLLSGIFVFATLPLEIPEKTSFPPPRNSVKLCATPWKFQGQKPRPKKISH